MLDTFLINLGLHPVYDPFPKVAAPRYSKSKKGATHERGREVRNDLFMFLANNPGSPTKVLAEAINRSSSHVLRSLREAEAQGRVTSRRGPSYSKVWSMAA